jgi:small conductance mechanosensitive channel
MEETIEMLQTEQTQKASLFRQYVQDAVPGFISFAMSVVGAVVVYLIGVRIIKLCRRLLKKVLMRHNVDEGVMQFLDAIAKFAGYFILILIILGFFGVTTASVVAVLGSAGLTLGLALQGSLSNFAGGVLILILKPFVVGDYIIDGSDTNEGFVQEISIFYTTLITGASQTIVIPNGTLLNDSITNLTKSGKRRLDVMIGVSYDTDIEAAKTALLRVAQHSSHRLEEPPVVLVSELAESCVKLDVRVWTTPLEYWDEMYELNEQIKISLDAEGIEIAFPQMDVHIR